MSLRELTLFPLAEPSVLASEASLGLSRTAKRERGKDQLLCPSREDTARANSPGRKPSSRKDSDGESDASFDDEEISPSGPPVEPSKS